MLKVVGDVDDKSQTIGGQQLGQPPDQLRASYPTGQGDYI